MLKILKFENGVCTKDMGVHKDVNPLAWQPKDETYEYIVVPWDYDHQDLSDIESQKMCTLTFSGVFFHRKPKADEL